MLTSLPIWLIFVVGRMKSKDLQIVASMIHSALNGSRGPRSLVCSRPTVQPVSWDLTWRRPASRCRHPPERSGKDRGLRPLCIVAPIPRLCLRKRGRGISNLQTPYLDSQTNYQPRPFFSFFFSSY